MKLSSTLKAALVASTVALAGVSCKSTQEKHQEKVQHILSVIQPTEDLVKQAWTYYDKRDDLSSLTPSQLKSLKERQPYLMMTARALEKWELSLSEYLQILQSPEHMIANDDLLLKIAVNPAINIHNFTVIGDDLEISTWRETSDIIKNPKIEVLAKWGTMKVTLTGEWFKCLYKWRDKSQIRARDKAELTPSWERSITLSTSLVVSKK